MGAGGLGIGGVGLGGGGGGGLASVNGDTGPDVVLSAVDVGALALTGGVMSGDIDMGGGSVVNETLTIVDTAVSATTAVLGSFDVYRATAAGITITVSTADITAGRPFLFIARNAGVSVGTPVTIDTEGGETIDGVSSIALIVDHASVDLYVTGGNLESK